MKKICLTCKQELDLHLFHKDKNGKGGLRGSCKDCTSKNKDSVKIKDRMKQRRAFIQQTGNLEYWKKRAETSNYRAKNSYQIQDKILGEDLLEYFNNHSECHYCTQSFKSHLDAKIEHVIPLVKNGKHNMINIVFACDRCNSIKNDKDDIEFFKYVELIYNNLKNKCQ